MVAGRRGPRLSSGCRCSGGRTCGRDPTPCTASPLHQVRRRRVDGGVPGTSGRYNACTIIYFDGCIYVSETIVLLGEGFVVVRILEIILGPFS